MLYRGLALIAVGALEEGPEEVDLALLPIGRSPAMVTFTDYARVVRTT